ncbi:replication-relaxation family protein [Paenibacillus farraposensis]|uniref:Replication-relaxation family protein n=1 Tax=Paenibacillus farraposensis TaxID=2807095 RepID=A0ABW4DGA2_9BACL|nr:replication-relaxation family protein [Paenibacillus farraposensis]MCC3379285.1 replication-relaxation family protein [Paenibacillus farraposensis]
MEGNISPLLQPEQTGEVLIKYPAFDDPFAYVKSVDPLTRHQYYYIERLIGNNWITERDLLIVKTLFVHRWMTFTQICDLFFEGTDRPTVRRRIRKLLKYGLLRTITWRSYSKTKSKAACPSLYEIGASGADILNFKYGMRVGARDPRTAKATDLNYKFKYILTNELYIQMKRELQLMHFEFTPLVYLGDDLQVPTARYILRTPDGGDLEFYLICHRDDGKWTKTLRFQVEFFKKLMNETKQQFILVILVSDDTKAALANKIVQLGGFADYTWFVTDNDLYNPNLMLATSFFDIENDEKQYFDLRSESN